MLYANTGASLTINLPADGTFGVSNAGCLLCFKQDQAGAITIDPNGTDTIVANQVGLSLDAGDKLVLASGVGNEVCLLARSASTWHSMAGSGGLTDGGP